MTAPRQLAPARGRWIPPPWAQPQLATAELGRGERTRVTVAFAAVDDGTLVTFTHTGFDAVVSDPGASEGYSEGWEEPLGWYAAAVAVRAARD